MVIKLNWVTEITHINNKMFFVDEQRFGPYKMWHHEHLFIKKVIKTEVTDKVSFKAPFGIIGKLMTPVFIIPQLKKIFNYRYKILEKNLTMSKTLIVGGTKGIGLNNPIT